MVVFQDKEAVLVTLYLYSTPFEVAAYQGLPGGNVIAKVLDKT